MSHEIRTPMNGSPRHDGFGSGHRPRTEQRDCLQYGENFGDSMLNIINDILDFSKIEAGKLELDRVRFAFGLRGKRLAARRYPRATEKMAWNWWVRAGNLPSS